jgi:hypothetical protein
LTVKKVTVLRNDRLRKQERLRYKFGPLVTLVGGAKGREQIDVIGQGCLLTGVTCESKCKG